MRAARGGEVFRVCRQQDPGGVKFYASLFFDLRPLPGVKGCHVF